MSTLHVRSKSIIFIISSFFLLILGNGCSKVGPEYTPAQPTEFPDSWEHNLSEEDSNMTQWWKAFHDPVLDTLVKKMYAQNLDLRSAGLRIMQSRAALGISEGLYLPQQQALSGSLAGVQNGSNTFASAGINFDVAWEMDLWGKYARGIESSEATLYASVASYDDILVSLIAEVARNYVNFRTAQERIAFAERNIEIQERVTKMTEVQFNAGNVSELDMQQARTQLYTTKSLLPGFKQLMITARNAIATLLGTIPQEIDPILSQTPQHKSTSWVTYTTVEQDGSRREHDYSGESFVPVADLRDDFRIDADVVRRRPDLRVAELQARAQSARIGSAEAELYPHFSLFGSVGFNSNNAADGWISAGDAIGISAGPSFRWNIFQYGRIKNQIRVQDALFQESLNNYNKKVLTAVAEVSNALNGYRLSREQLELNVKSIEATVRAFELSMTQYDNGMVTYQRLLSTVEKLIQNEDNYAQIKGNMAIQYIALYKSLGGGWKMGRDKPFLNVSDVIQMKARSDWGEYLDDDAIIIHEADH